MATVVVDKISPLDGRTMTDRWPQWSNGYGACPECERCMVQLPPKAKLFSHNKMFKELIHSFIQNKNDYDVSVLNIILAF